MVSRSGKASRFSEEKVRAMGRDTSGVQGMNVSDKVDGTPNRVLAMDIARPETDVFVVTENGYGKRTPVEDYPVKGRGTKGNLTAKLTEKKGGLAGAMIVREHQDLLFISVNGMVQRTSVQGDLADGPGDAGRQGDEHRRRRPGQRRRAGGRAAGGGGAARGRGAAARGARRDRSAADEIESRRRCPTTDAEPRATTRTPSEPTSRGPLCPTCPVCFNQRTRERRWS